MLGLSWGGGLAQQLRRPVTAGGCAGVVLVATGTGSLMVPAHPRVLAKMLDAAAAPRPGVRRSIAGEIYGGTMRTDPERGGPRCCTPTTRLGPRRGYYYQLAASTGWTACRSCS